MTATATARRRSLAEQVAAARRAGEAGRRASVAVLSEEAKATFDRIVGEAIAAGAPFTLDDLRERLDVAQIPNSARGGLIQRAIKAGRIESIGFRRSRHVATHNKPISVYRGVSR